MLCQITQKLNNASKLMTDCQVRTQKCDFCFILTSLNNDDQSCVHRLKILKILGGIVDQMIIAYCLELSISRTDFVEPCNVSKDHNQFQRNIFLYRRQINAWGEDQSRN